MSIEILSQQLANQIAAGEVIEGPVSVVKECVENAIDAAATHIDIHLEKAGHAVIRIRDNGQGMSQQDLQRCVLPHATSKIHNLEDLQAIATLGFRGEALASIASVAQLSITSSTEDAEHAWVGKAAPQASGHDMDWTLAPSTHPTGTTVAVHELFYLTPARKKFMRSERSDLKSIKQWVERLALAHFDVGFTLYNDGKNILNCPLADSWALIEKRVADLLGANFLKHSRYIDEKASGIRIYGWISLPQYDRSQPDQQMSFINHRFIRDKIIMGAAKQAYRKLLFHGRHPAYILYIDCDPTIVDVNVHPSKAEVRFADSRSIFQLVHSTLAKALQDIPVYITEIAPHNDNVTPDNNTDINSQPLFSFKAAPMPFKAERTPDAEVVVEERPECDPYQPQISNSIIQPIQLPLNQIQDALVKKPEKPVTAAVNKSLGEAIAQCHGRYIIAQNEKGMVVVDQHAAHERILFETFKLTMLDKMAKQTLLVSETILLDAAEEDSLARFIALLTPLGFDIKKHGNNGICIHAIPAVLKTCDFQTVMATVWGDFLQDQHEAPMDYYMDRLIANMACKAAIKVNHPLGVVQMNALLRQMETCPYGGLCNHGRPAVQFFSLAQMDSWFLRGQ